jgi:hypothetical protein
MQPAALLAALVAANVDFVLIGGLAATIRGTTRVTRDIDIAYATHAQNLQRLCSILNQYEPQRIDLGEIVGAVMTLTPTMLKQHGVLQLSTALGEVDLLNRIDGFKSYGAIKALSQELTLANGSVTVAVLSIDGLLKTKRAMNRPKDKQDIVELEAIKQAMAIGDAGADSF